MNFDKRAKLAGAFAVGTLALALGGYVVSQDLMVEPVPTPAENRIAAALRPGPPAPNGDALDPLPSWAYVDFQRAVEREVDPSGSAHVTVRLLAWESIQDTRPLFVNTALTWAKIESGRGQRWAIALMYQHPNASDPGWWRADIRDVEWEPIVFFDSPPKNPEIYAFLDACPPPRFFQTIRHFERVASGLRSETWRAVVGEDPLRTFEPLAAVKGVA